MFPNPFPQKAAAPNPPIALRPLRLEADALWQQNLYTTIGYEQETVSPTVCGSRLLRYPIAMNRLTTPFRRLQWKLTLSYTLVTTGALLVVELLFFGVGR